MQLDSYFGFQQLQVHCCLCRGSSQHHCWCSVLLAWTLQIYSLLPSSPPGTTIPASWQYSTDSANNRKQPQFPFFQALRTSMSHSNFKMKISQYRVQTFADGTKASYRTHRERYLQFWEHMVTPSQLNLSISFSMQPFYLAVSKLLLFQITFNLIILLVYFSIRNLTCQIPPLTIGYYILF